MGDKIKTMLAVMVMAVGGGLVVSGPAQAYSGCPSQSICFFSGILGGGQRLVDHDSVDTGCHSYLPDNRTRSIDNKQASGSQQVRVYRSSNNCTGESTLVYANTEGNMSGIWYDSIDSFYVYS